MNRSTLRYLGAAALVLLWTAPTHANTHIQGYQAKLHDRFYTGAGRAFIGEEFDWSGVGQFTGGQWATLISPSFYLTCKHWYGTGQVTFHEDDNPAGITHTYTTSTVFTFTNSDLLLVKLASPVPAADHIRSYPIFSLAGTGETYIGREVFVYGQPNRVGRNNITYAGSTTMGYAYNIPGLGTDEAYIISGDSGGPTFTDVGSGILALVGTHSTNNGSPPYDGASSGDNFVSGLLPQIIAKMAPYNEAPQVIPEPTTALLLGLAALTLPRRRSRPRGRPE